MIDICTPIPNTLNDKDSEKLLNELRELNNQGIESFVPSKRISCSIFEEPFFRNYKSFLDNISKKSNVKVYYGPLIRFSTASEFVHISDKLRLNGGRYVNIELSSRSHWNSRYISQLAEFIRYSGTVPVIIAVEKYPAVKKNYKVLTKLAELGCVFSVSLTSFSDKAYKKLIKKLIKHGFIHLLVTGMQPDILAGKNIKELLESAKEVIGSKSFDTIMDNSRLVIENKKLKPLK